LGDTQVNNTLEMIIPKPDITMAQGTTGQLEVIMPSWYTIGEVDIPSFKNTMCASPCMNFAWAWAHSNTIYLKYKDLSDKCRKDDKVTITCRGFRSPISPGNQNNDVKISTFDNEKDQRPIAILKGNLKDTVFMPVLIPNEDLKIEAVATKTEVVDVKAVKAVVEKKNANGDVEVAAKAGVPAVMKSVDTYKILLSLKVPIPMMKQCFINVYMPQQLEIITDSTEMQGFGLFSAEGSTSMDKTESTEPRTGKKFYQFSGCNQIDGIGPDPYGTLVLNNVRRKDGQVTTGGHFRIQIYGKTEDGL